MFKAGFLTNLMRRYENIWGFGLSSFPVVVTTSIITCFVGDIFYLQLQTITGKRGNPKNTLIVKHRHLALEIPHFGSSESRKPRRAALIKIGILIFLGSKGAREAMTFPLIVNRELFGASSQIPSPPKTNMEPKNECLKDDVPFQLGDFRFYVNFPGCKPSST